MGMMKWATAAFIVSMPVILMVLVGLCIWHFCSNAPRLRRQKSERVANLSAVPDESQVHAEEEDALDEHGEKIVQVVEVKTEE
mmetsp:Transcript_10720/g.22133  ORF Transcript_10720/g.22133 Transcript_10720/m.22133 type:complete len:83 (+) Transcript_10720:276-524(+)